MNKELDKVLSIMERALKNDIAIELYNDNFEEMSKQKRYDSSELYLTINVYHLSDIYSTQYSLTNNIIIRSESYSVTQFRNKLAKDLLFAIQQYMQTPHAKWINIQEIFAYYSEIFHEVYKIKYSNTRSLDFYSKFES